MIKHKIIIDTDIGTDVDDAYACVLAMRSPELKIEAITTVYGDTDTRAKIAKKIADLEGYKTVVSVGERKPLFSYDPDYRTGLEGAGFLADAELSRMPQETGTNLNAVSTITQKIMDNPKEITIVTIGPLTNIAKMLENNPEIKEQIKQIYTMGGSFRWPDSLAANNIYGHYNSIREHNIASDIKAAQIIFESGIPITLFPLDITTKLLLRREDLKKLIKKKDELSAGLARMTEVWFAYKSINETPMHDSLTIAALCKPEIVKKIRSKVEITDSGITLANKTPGNIEVCYDVDVEKFNQFFMRRLINYKNG